MSKEKALSIVDHIEGTLIADLQSLELVALERQSDNEMKSKLPGALNYTLFLTGLIACETIGFLISEKSKSGDTNECIKYFIKSKYFKSPDLNKSKYIEALIRLRTNLAHLYGFTDFALKEIDKELVLCVGGVTYPPLMSDNKQVKLNGIKFVKIVIDAFNQIKQEVANGGTNLPKIILGKSQI